MNEEPLEKNDEARQRLTFEESLARTESNSNYLIQGDKEMTAIAWEIYCLRGSGILTMLRGKPGSGKGGLAGYIHLCDYPTNGMPFISVNLGSLPRSLLESELYGHRKGAFSSAIEDRVGRFGAIEKGGTLFLDEVATLSKEDQPKLLTALGSAREFSRVGENEAHVYQGRVVCATNEDLVRGLRSDVFSRVAACAFEMPSFQRREPSYKGKLAEQILLKYLKRTNRTNILMSPEAIDFLSNADIPQEVRGFESIIERAASHAWSAHASAISRADVEQAHKFCCKSFEQHLNEKPPEASEAQASQNEMYSFPIDGPIPEQDKLDFLKDRLLKQLLMESLSKHAGNQSRAAAEIGISRETIRTYVKQFGISVQTHVD